MYWCVCLVVCVCVLVLVHVFGWGQGMCCAVLALLWVSVGVWVRVLVCVCVCACVRVHVCVLGGRGDAAQAMCSAGSTVNKCGSVGACTGVCVCAFACACVVGGGKQCKCCALLALLGVNVGVCVSGTSFGVSVFHTQKHTQPVLTSFCRSQMC